MKEIRLETGETRDKWAPPHFLFALLEFSDEEMTVSIGPDCPPEHRVTSMLWEHTFFELEKFAEALKFVANGQLPDYYEVPSRGMLISPSVGLPPAIQIELGHPGIGEPGRGTMFYVSRRKGPLGKRYLVKIEAMNDFRSERTSWEIEDALRFAEEIYEQARLLALRR